MAIAMHSQEALLQGLLELAPDAIVGVGSDGLIVLANTQAEQLLGYERGELLGQPLQILVPERARSIHPSHMQRYETDPRPRPMGIGMELAARRKDGSEFPAEISLRPMETGSGMLVAAAIRDITEQTQHAERERLKMQAEGQRSQTQLQESERLEGLGQLAGGVAHDFNNLLAVILNYASFVAEEVGAAALAPGGKRWEAASRDIAQIQRAAERATRLTHKLLAFGHHEVSRPEVLSLNDVIEDVKELLRRTLGENIVLVTSLEGDPWPILADPGQMEQVLINLALNARDAMPVAGVLTISTENIHVDDAYAATRPGVQTGCYVRLRVSDTGGGMSKDVIRHAFEPFFTTKTKGEGSGLGLATVYGVIAQHGGNAQIYSEVGMGTTFSGLLPATEETEAPHPEQVDLQETGGGETVLLVEDEDALLEVSRRILARNGYNVISASGGGEALVLAQNHEADIDLLITDVVMPHMQGRELAEALGRVRPGLRVLYMSGYARPVLASRGILETGVALLEKPFAEPTLLAKVRETLNA